MSINLLSMIKEVAGDAMVQQASNFLNAEETTTKSAFGAAIPSLLGSMIEKGSDDAGARSLLNFINTNNHDGSILDKVGDMLDGGATTDGLLNSGGGILKYLLGDKLGNLTDLISKVSGMKVGHSSSLLKMLSPVIMGVIGRYLNNKALDAVGFKNLLLNQRSHVKNALPAGFSKIMGFTSFDSISEEISEDVSKASEKVKEISNRASREPKESRFMPWLLGILALIALVFLLRKGCSGTPAGDAVDNMTEKVEETAEEVATDVSQATEKMGEEIASIKLPGGAEITTKAGSFLDNLAKFISGGESDPERGFTFDNLEFEKGSDQITSESREHLDHMVSILKAYEKVHIQIAGHTDNTGDAAANKTLSENRAKSVKAYLVNNGIAGARIEAVGFGQERPIASNTTEEGQSHNRRVEIYVLKN